jgi:hypothetical protein
VTTTTKEPDMANHIHPADLLFVHRLDTERLERDLARRSAVRRPAARRSRVRRHASSAWQALAHRSQTISPRPTSIWDDLGLRPSR